MNVRDMSEDELKKNILDGLIWYGEGSEAVKQFRDELWRRAKASLDGDRQSDDRQ